MRVFLIGELAEPCTQLCMNIGTPLRNVMKGECIICGEIIRDTHRRHSRS